MAAHFAMIEETTPGMHGSVLSLCRQCSYLQAVSVNIEVPLRLMSHRRRFFAFVSRVSRQRLLAAATNAMRNDLCLPSRPNIDRGIPAYAFVTTPRYRFTSSLDERRRDLLADHPWTSTGRHSHARGERGRKALGAAHPILVPIAVEL